MTPRAQHLLAALLIAALFGSLFVGASLAKLLVYAFCFYGFCLLVGSLERAAMRRVDRYVDRLVDEGLDYRPGVLPGERTRDGAR